MKTVEEVYRLLDTLVPDPLPSESVAASSALGRVLRQSVQAPEDQPPFHRSSIDGYLLRQDAQPGLLKVTGTHPPGKIAPSLPQPGTAIRIFTGSALPPEAALVMQEDTRTNTDGSLEILKHPDPNLVRGRGSQARKGDPLITPPAILQPGTIALLASLGLSEIRVSPLPRVAHLVTGEELVDWTNKPGSGQIRDCNSPLVASLLASFPAHMIWHQRIGDEKPACLEALHRAVEAGAQMILISGASSVGDKDHTASVLQDSGFEILVRQVRVKPGKPLLVARRGDCLAFGLPGNPLSHFVGYHLFVRRVLRRWAGLPSANCLEVELDDSHRIAGDARETWWPGRLETGQGRHRVKALPWRDSSDLTCLATADCLIRIPAGEQARSPVQVLPTISP